VICPFFDGGFWDGYLGPDTRQLIDGFWVSFPLKRWAATLSFISALELLDGTKGTDCLPWMIIDYIPFCLSFALSRSGAVPLYTWKVHKASSS
jgi:hypothetical protein